MSFINAMQTKDVVTENGMPAHSTTGSSVLDFFSKSGALRKNPAQGLRLFQFAYAEDPLLALKALFYARDIRGGQGERQLVRSCLAWLAQEHPAIVHKNLENIVKFGRWDDLMALTNTDVQTVAVNMWADAIQSNDGLAAKWLPRKGPWFAWTRKAVGMKCGQWRRFVASKTSVIETLMCRKEWSGINYSHVPSVANTRYMKAFHRNDGERYRLFIQKAVKGEVKIHSGALYPSDIVKLTTPYGIMAEEDKTADALWNQLPNWLEGSNQRILPMCDVSGSMNGEPMLVSVSLGLYVSERLTGPFKDVMLTFSESPEFHKIKGKTLAQRVNSLSTASWGMNTNLELAFKSMLDRAVKAELDPAEMPTTLLIISDMQFDQCAKGPGKSAMEMIKKSYEKHGYELPKVVFWNVRASKGQPAKENSQGVALVSGYSPSIMKSILDMKPQATPYELMVETLNGERYESVTL